MNESLSVLYLFIFFLSVASAKLGPTGQRASDPGGVSGPLDPGPQYKVTWLALIVGKSIKVQHSHHPRRVKITNNKQLRGDAGLTWTDARVTAVVHVVCSHFVQGFCFGGGEGRGL